MAAMVVTAASVAVPRSRGLRRGRRWDDGEVSTAVLLPVSFFVLLAGALLFVNAIEWLGVRLSLAQGAVGSLLAAVATALPESLIPITAIIAGGEGSDEVATGAILGAPFLLATLAMALVGRLRVPLAAPAPAGNRPGGALPDPRARPRLLPRLLRRRLRAGRDRRAAVAAHRRRRGLVLAYAMYVRLTLAGTGEVRCRGGAARR